MVCIEVLSIASKINNIHTQKSVKANFGAYWQETITKDLILEHVSRKKSKISDYKQNTNLPQPT